MPEFALSRFAARVLQGLADGRKAVPCTDGDFMLGAIRVPGHVIERLAAADLLVGNRDGLSITPAGKACLRRRRPSPRPAIGETPDCYRAQHMELSVASPSGTRMKMLRNQAESPIGRLSRRRGRDGRPLISARQYDAGEKLREDFEAAGLGPRVTLSYDSPPISRSRRAAPDMPTATERQIHARQRLQRALDLAGPGMGDLLLRVCCYLEGLEDAERALGWPVRSGKTVLALALDRLADHYEGRRPPIDWLERCTNMDKNA